MALILADRVRETSTTTGTGALSLAGAVVGYQTFSSAIGNTNTCYYAISNPGVAEWEVGIGTYATSGNTLTRTTILKSSNSNAAVNFSAGTKDVFVTYPATKSVYLDASGNVTLTGTLTANTIGAFTLGGTVAGGGNQLNNVIIGTTNPLAGAFTTLSASTTAGATNGTFRSTNSTAQVYNIVAQNDGSTVIGSGVYGSTAGTFANISASDAFIATNSAKLIINSPTTTSIGIGATPSNIATFTSTGLAVTGTLSATDSVAFGAATLTGLTTGDIGLKNNAAIRFRNAANSAYLNAIYVDSSNNLQLGGGGATANTIIACAGTGTIGTFSSTGLAVTGTLSTTDAVTITKNGNADTTFRMTNSTSGTSAGTSLFIGDGISNVSGLLHYNTSHSAYGNLVAGDSALYSTWQTMRFANDIASPIWKWTGASGLTTDYMSLTSTGLAVTGLISSTGTNGILRLLDGNTAGGVKIGAYNAAFTANGYLAFEGYSSEYGRFDSSGNLGIGTTAPSALLDLESSGTTQLEITSTGASGNMYVLSSRADGTFRIADDSAGQSRLTIDENGNLGIGTTAPAANLNIFAANTVTNSNGNLYVQTSTTAGTDVGGQISLGGYHNGTSSSTPFASIAGRKENATAGNQAGYLAFSTDTSGGTNTERARINSIGDLLVNQTAAGLQNSNSFGCGPSDVGFVANHVSGTAGGTTFGNFGLAGTGIGSITQNGTTAVAYNTTSDYRLKENIAPMTGALAKVALLKPCTYTWKAAPEEIGEGFIAHELSEVCPNAVTGEKDAVEMRQYEISPAVPATFDGEGNELTAAVEAVMGEREVPKYQGIDTSFLVATLTAALQEAHGLIKDLTTRITALEAK